VEEGETTEGEQKDAPDPTAVLSPNGESAAMMPICKNMPMSPTTTEALAATTVVVPCMKEGENRFEDEDEWKDIMEEHGAKDQDRQEPVHEARDKELMQAAVEGRVFVVALDANRVKSAEQARSSGKTLLLWCAQRSSVKKILPEGMVPPEARTAEHMQLILGSWLEHGELSTVARRQKASYQDKYRRTDRMEQNPPWMATMTLSSASTPSDGKLGKLVGAMALGFEMRDVPQHIKHMMQGKSGDGTTCKIKATRSAKGMERHHHAVTERSRGCQMPPGQWAGELQALELVEKQCRSGGRCLRVDGHGSKNNNGMKKSKRANSGCGGA
jgi:hypothetical protein